jgi:LmbE family N-acetylglucosaminyl deacetylase
MKPIRLAAVLLLLSAAPALVAAAPPGEMSAAEIRLALAKLNVVGRVLYVAAHPDDENTAFLAWGAKGRLLDAGYLAMTRGDGGQNLIGSESAELLGVLRTEELLAARRVDGATQFFTRAIDFGYSKSPAETLTIWDREKALADVVRVFRTFRPDVVVNRFPTTGEGGHGQHTASAILSVEAFEAAGDPARFPEQIAEGLRPWKPRRVYFNVFRFRSDQPRTEVAGGVSVDLGAYNALLGRSYTEIAAQSRSMHKSQGFGSAERRGSWVNDFQLLKGDKAEKDLFEGIDLTWKRIPGGDPVAPLLAEAERTFRDGDPAASLPVLLRAHAAMKALPESPWKAGKLAALAEVIRACAGLWTEAVAESPFATPGSDVKVSLMTLNRSAFPIALEGADVTFGSAPAAGGGLKDNEPLKATVTVKIPADAAPTQPFWLAKPASKGLFGVSDEKLIGLPVGPPPLVARFRVKAGGETLVFEAPVVFRKTDPVLGEVYQPFEIAPAVTANFDERVYAFPAAAPKNVAVALRSKAAASGALRLALPPGWSAVPREAPFSFAAAGGAATAVFTVTPPAKASEAVLAAEIVAPGASAARSAVVIDYPHIPRLTLFPVAEAKLLRLDVAVPARAVGYVMGSGDAGPEALRQLGIPVTLLSDDDLASGDLSRFGTIVAGIRAYNTRERLKSANRRLLDFVEQGGTLVVQYDTSSDLVTEEIGPKPFKISRDRVTVEEAPVTFTLPSHPLLTTPNGITQADFEGWVQERGLYFAGTWDPAYETPLSTGDPGEPAKAGSLIFLRHGKGTFVYTGLSFFRQLPAGVPGAYRLFVNLVSGGR